MNKWVGEGITHQRNKRSPRHNAEGPAKKSVIRRYEPCQPEVPLGPG